MQLLFGKALTLTKINQTLINEIISFRRAATKAKTDGAKAKKNNLFAKRVIIAVKAGGGVTDPEVNRGLAQVISDAKAAQVPKDIIARNIEKAGSANAADFKQSVFEFYGHGG